MRLTLSLLSLLLAFFALSYSVNGDVSQHEQSLTTEVDEATGAVYHIIDSGGDEDGDDDEPQTPTTGTKESRSEGALEARKRTRKHKHKSKAARKGRQNFLIGKPPGVKEFPRRMEITWYASNDLKNPACGDGSWDPNNNNHIGAVMKSWTSGPQCGDFVYICNEDAHNHCVRVRVVDYCAGCDTDAVDLSKSAFKKLSPSGGLDEGRIKNLKMYHSSRPNPFDIGLFGPFRLKKK